MKLRFLLALSLAAIASFGFAQHYDRTYRPYLTSPYLLSSKKVQGELKLTPLQIQRVTEAFKFEPDIAGLTPDEEKKRNELNERKRNFRIAKLPSELSTDQVKRLRELGIQKLGMLALLDAGIQCDLGIATKQDEALGAALELAYSGYYIALAIQGPNPFLDDKLPLDTRLRMLEEFRQVEHRNRSANERAAREFDAAAIRILDKGQMVAFRHMQGRPFFDEYYFGSIATQMNKMLYSATIRAELGIKSAKDPLSAAQRTRLRELALQYLGLDAVFDEETANEIGVPFEQLSDIKRAVDAAYLDVSYDLWVVRFREMAAPEAIVVPTDPAELDLFVTRRAEQYRDEEAQSQQNAHDRVQTAMLQALTPAQRSLWQSLQGKPFANMKQVRKEIR